jgi:hypothetical protein
MFRREFQCIHQHVLNQPIFIMAIHMVYQNSKQKLPEAGVFRPPVHLRVSTGCAAMPVGLTTLCAGPTVYQVESRKVNLGCSIPYMPS